MAYRAVSKVAAQASRAAFVVCVLSLATVTEAQVAGTAQIAEAAAREAALVQFYGGGSPLTPRERADLCL